MTISQIMTVSQLKSQIEIPSVRESGVYLLTGQVDANQPSISAELQAVPHLTVEILTTRPTTRMFNQRIKLAQDE